MILQSCFGAGVGQGNTDDKSDQSGGGGGGGATVKPVGFLVWDGKEVKFVNVASKGSIDNLVEMVPGLLKKFGLTKKKDKEKSKSVGKDKAEE